MQFLISGWSQQFERRHSTKCLFSQRLTDFALLFFIVNALLGRPTVARCEDSTPQIVVLVISDQGGSVCVNSTAKQEPQPDHPSNYVTFKADPQDLKTGVHKVPVGKFILSAGIYLINCGSRIWVEGKATAHIYIDAKPDIYRQKNVKQWALLPFVDSQLTDSIAAQTRRAERDKSPKQVTAIITPDGEDAYIPTFRVRWSAKGKSRNASVRILMIDTATREPLGRPLLARAKDGFSSDAVTEELHRQLRKWQKDYSESVSADASVYLTVGGEQGVKFSLMSEQQETDVTAALAKWDKSPEVRRHLGRAAVYKRYRLFSESLEEYRTVLKLSGRDPLLQIAIDDLTDAIGPS